MHSPSLKWKKLFLFCLGIALGVGFCMKWIETDFWYAGERFTILGLEWFYPEEKVMKILSSLDPVTKTSLRYHLIFDFAFMVGVYPAIAAYGVLIAGRATPSIRRLLVVVASLQLLAWLCDIGENAYLLKWLASPHFHSDWKIYYLIVGVKWLIVLAGIILPSMVWLFRALKRK